VSWLKIDDGFGEHEKIIDLSDRSFRLHVVALCYCARNLTDGRLRKRQVAAVCAITGATRRNLVELVSAGLWDEYGKDGYRINDYLDYNPPSAEVKQKREEAKERMRRRRSRERSREQTENVRPTNGQGVFADPVPSPTRKDLKPLQASVKETVERSLKGVA
jgi:hypothetical protein